MLRLFLQEQKGLWGLGKGRSPFPTSQRREAFPGLWLCRAGTHPTPSARDVLLHPSQALGPNAGGQR